VPAGGGKEEKLTTQGGESCFASADGRFVYYYTSRKTRSIWKVALQGGEETHVLDMPKKGNWRDWALTENGIYFLDPDGPGRLLFQFFDFARQTTTPIAQFECNPSETFTGCVVSPDGEWFLYWRWGSWSSPSDIMLVENFR
jgi:hypothetical protein